jgi:glycosyltransferase involved in cell wall biosynthesis
LVVHDTRPMRAQRGMGLPSRLLARLALRRTKRVTLVVHSESAMRDLRTFGLGRSARYVPHPILPAPRLPDRQGAETSDVLVLGQFKPSRDLSVLEAVARAAPSGWDLRVIGRGWPAIPGWTVTDSFVTEEEFDTLLCHTRLLLVPYRHVYQSGVALRALECGSPVVGPQVGCLEEAFGSDWPGLVGPDASGDAWAVVVSDMLSRSADGLREAASAARDRYDRGARQAWESLAESRGRPPHAAPGTTTPSES